MSDADTTLSRINIYPIKSAAGISLDTSEVDDRGLRHDRRWMLVDEEGVFLSQRRLPRMALIRVSLHSDGLAVDAPGMPALSVPFEPVDGDPIQAKIWSDETTVLPVGEEADQWFGGFLGARCRLVYLPESSVRIVRQDYGRSGDQVGLADGFPFLLISEASLENLNGRLEKPLPMNRFRPNLVVRSCPAHAEDRWSRIRIGEMEFRVVKPCARCAIPTIDQQTAGRGKEPLRTLATYRRFSGKVLFGQNLIHDSTGTLKVGDPLEVVSAASNSL